MNTWIKGLIAAAIGGAAAAITASVADPATFNFSEGIYKLASVAGISAIVAAAAYLTKSPLWNNDTTGGTK